MTKILNHINTYADLTAYDNDLNKDFPNVSYIQGSDEVKWYKYDPEYIVCKYNVVSTINATTLLNSNTDITYQIIDGVQQDAVQTTYTFDTRGEHTVKYKLGGTSIGTSAFVNCTGLTSVTIPSGVTSIGSYAFQGCTGLKSIEIPNSVTSIGTSAFVKCSGITSITIPDSVTSISDRAFVNCKGLTSVTIGSGVTSIGLYAFSACSKLESITIPSDVTSIGGNAFYNCTGLTSVTIGTGINSIGGNAFNGCSGLTSVTIEATEPPTLGTNAFNKTNDCPIYVPAESVETYKAANVWIALADRIQPISE